MPIPSGFASHIDLLDPLCYPGSGLIIDDLANPSVAWNISASGAVYDGSVGALALSTQSIEANGQLINTGDGPITIAGWVKVNQYTYAANFNNLPAVGANSDGANFRQISLYGGTPNAVGLGNATNVSAGAVYGTVESPINTWVFVVIKKNTGQTTSQFKTYINGATNEAGSFGTNTTTSIAYTGTYSYGLINGSKFGASAFPMSISQLWMYNSYLSDADVLDLYNSTKARYALQTSFDFQNSACFTNGGTTITDLSGNGNNFTLNNTSYTYDSTLGAITFPSGTYADGTPSDYAFGTNPFSVLAWVKFNTSVPGINVFHFGGSGGGERTAFLWRSSDNLIVCDNASSAGAWDQTADNQWHLLAITRPSNAICNQQKVYLDGTLIAFSSSAFNPTQPLNATLGAARIHDTAFGSGDLEIATFDVYTTELNAGDITTFYNDTKDRFLLKSHIDLLDPACYSGTGNTIFDLVNPSAKWEISGSSTYDSIVGALTWGATTEILLDTQLSQSGTTGRTMAAWIKWPQDGPVNPGEGVQPFLQIGDDTSYNNMCLTMASNTEIGGRFPILKSGDSFNSIVTAVAYTPNWTFVAMTVPNASGASSGNIYLNGTTVGSPLSYNTPAGTLNVTYTSNQFGIYNHDFGLYGTQSAGTVSQHWIYDTVLTAGEILDLYNSTKNRYATPIAQYDFSDTATWTGTGNTVYDLTANNNDLTLTNSPTLAGIGQSKVIVLNGTNQDARKTTPLTGLTGTPFTINTWVKWPTLPNPATFAAVWTYGTAYPSAQWNGMFKMLSNPYITYVTGLGATQITSSTTNAPDTFYNLIITNNTPNTLDLYINGVSAGTATQSFTFEGSAGFYVGSNLGGDGFSDSQIALLEVYNVGFGSTDVTNLYNTQLTRFNPAPPPYAGNVGGRSFGQGFNG